jgi:tetratricopeptide (TPR) repeat protein
MPKDATGLESLPARELRGLIALAGGQKEAALKELAQAAAIDQQATGHIGTPPNPVKPATELYGEVLAEMGRDKDALEQFETSLTLMRRRPLSLLGAARASQRLGLAAKAAGYYQELREVWKIADADHPFVAEVRRATND